MYTHPEIELIFQNCKTWSDLEIACNAFAYIIKLDELTALKIWHIRTKSTERFRELENL